MWNLPKGDAFLPETEIADLQRLYEHEQKGKPKMRLLCAIHRKEGESLDEIALQLKMHRRTVHAILRRFIERGVAGKDSIKQPGRPARLTQVQRRALIRRLEQGPPRNASGLWTTKEVRELIRRKFGINYSAAHVWELLKIAGFTVQRPRPRHYKSPTKEEDELSKKRLAGWRAIIGERGS